MIVKLLAEYHLEFLSLKGGCRGSSRSALVKMSNCLKSHAVALMLKRYWVCAGHHNPQICEKEIYLHLKCKGEGKDQESMQSNTTRDPGPRMGKWQKQKKMSHAREPWGQPLPNSWPQCCNEQTRQYDRLTRNTNNKKDPQKKHWLGTASK